MSRNSPRFNPKIGLWTLSGRQYPGRLDSSLQYSRHDSCTFPATKKHAEKSDLYLSVESQQPNGSAAAFTLHVENNRQFTLGKDQEENDATFFSAPSTSVLDFFPKHRFGWWIWMGWPSGHEKTIVIWLFFGGCILMEWIEAPKFVEQKHEIPWCSWRGWDRGSLGLDIFGWSWYSYQQKLDRCNSHVLFDNNPPFKGEMFVTGR